GTAPAGTAPAAPPGGQAGNPGGRGGRGGAGGLLGSGNGDAQVTALISANASTYSWAAATVGSNNAALYQLSSGQAVMPVGGFNGSDPAPTLAQFKAYVAAGSIHYFIAGSLGQSNGGSQAASSIASWVAANFTATTVNSVTLYDLTQ
ncbi:MAG: glycosyl transferase family 39, partial [Glaciihabitans sp.]|nr:glycosyl transferase family 39 [Glaciihabitans sp.]